MKNWAVEFEHHLMEDVKPSEYFDGLVNTGEFPESSPYTMLSDLIDVEQSTQHHPEGNAWIHTMLVVDNAAALRDKSRLPRAFMWAALLHDLGKVPSTRVINGRIVAYDHDATGEILARDFLTQCGMDKAFVKSVSALVRWHMQPFFIVRNMPFSDIDSMVNQADYNEVALLSFCDRMGRGDTSEKKIKLEEQNMSRFLQKCKKHKDRHAN